MTEKRFTIVNEEFILYFSGTAHKISNGECTFRLWHNKEESQTVCDKLNKLNEENEELKHHISELQGENEILTKENKELKKGYKELEKENEELKKENKTLTVQKLEIRKWVNDKISDLEKKYEFGQTEYKGCPMHNIQFGINILKELREYWEEQEND